MKGASFSRTVFILILFSASSWSVHSALQRDRAQQFRIDRAQIPTWSAEDLRFFLHGSMGTEVMPERILRAFMHIYPDLFPTQDLGHLGLIPDAEFGWPIGFSRREVKQLGNLSAVGINCASWHVAEVKTKSDDTPQRILGGTSHFDVEAFFGSVLVATFRTADPPNMKRFLAAYLEADDQEEKSFNTEWARQEEKINAAIKADPFGAHGVEPGSLQ